MRAWQISRQWKVDGETWTVGREKKKPHTKLRHTYVPMYIGAFGVLFITNKLHVVRTQTPFNPIDPIRDHRFDLISLVIDIPKTYYAPYTDKYLRTTKHRVFVSTTHTPIMLLPLTVIPIHKRITWMVWGDSVWGNGFSLCRKKNGRLMCECK